MASAFAMLRRDKRRDERAYPWWICERGATKPGGPLRENPPGGASFARGRRWLVAYSPLRGCSQLAALATAKIRCRRATFNFKADSQTGTELVQNWLFIDQIAMKKSEIHGVISLCAVVAGLILGGMLPMRVHGQLLGPPKILVPPSDQTVTNMGSATFSVKIDASISLTLSYQWQFNG